MTMDWLHQPCNLTYSDINVIDIVLLYFFKQMYIYIYIYIYISGLGSNT